MGKETAPHPEDTPREVVFVRQVEAHWRECLRMARRLIAEAVPHADWESEGAKERIESISPLIADSISRQLGNTSLMIQQASPKRMDEIAEGNDRVTGAMKTANDAAERARDA